MNRIGERILIRKGMKISLEVETVLKRKFGIKWFRPSEEDELRLLRLDQWREKYHVTLTWMLMELIPYWRKKYSQYGNGSGMGVTVATLTGEISERIIVSRIKEVFPDNQLERAWRAKEQDSQWEEIFDRGRCREDWDNPQIALRQYRNRILEERGERQKWQKKLSQRRYRGNPWLT